MKRTRKPFIFIALISVFFITLFGQMTSARAEWQILTLDRKGDVGDNSSLALDSSGFPHISYLDWADRALNYAHWSGSGWIITTVDSSGKVGLDSSLALDSSGKPQISYYDDGGGNLKYASWNGSRWNVRTMPIRLAQARLILQD